MFTWGKLEWNMSIIIREGEVVKKTVIDSERLEICAGHHLPGQSELYLVSLWY